jgi:hypothetical protein
MSLGIIFTTSIYLLTRVPSKAVPKTPFELWTRRKPSLRHLHVWGCPTEARFYNPYKKKLDLRTISGYFIGYLEKSKKFRFYCPNHSMRIVETGNARFIENGEISGSDNLRNVDIQEVRVQVPMPITSNKIVVPIVVEQPNNIEQQINEPSLHNNMVTNEQTVEEPQGVALRRSQRERRSAISDEYVVYLQESDFDIGSSTDPILLSQALESVDSTKWMNTMKDELKSMNQNEVWDLVELPEGYKKVGCKWV